MIDPVALLHPADLPDPLRVPRLTHPIHTSLTLPGSKSITNRALVCAALAPGVSTLHNVLQADDTEAMLTSLVALGAEVRRHDRDTVTVGPLDLGSAREPVRIDARQSGTTSRFLAPVLALKAHGDILDGHPQLRERPFDDLLDALSSLGATITSAAGGRLPMQFRGAISDRTATLPGDVSSQFASGLLLAGPRMPDGLELELTGEIVSRPYLDLTVAVMRTFGADVETDGDGRHFAVAGSGYRAAELTIEPDASAASYFFGLAAVSGGSIEVEGLGAASLQGDVGFVDVLEAMGASVERTDSSTRVTGPDRLRGIDVDLRHLSDTAPTLGAVAACAEGTTSVTGIGFIRHKESDRIHATVTELRRLGVDAVETDDGFTVVGGPTGEAVVATYDDHRIAMAFTVLGMVRGGVAIAEPACVAKTFPGFFATIFGLASSAGMETHDTPASEAARRVIAIDGPSGSGKSTVARALADRLGMAYLDTGAMYRAVAFAALRHDIDPGDDDAVAALARAIDLRVSPEGVFVDGVDGTVEIRGPEVTRAVSAVAANLDVRRELQLRQREWATRHGGGVIEGRDIGTVVFPEARLKVFLTAHSEVRAVRRAQEVTDLDYATVAADLVRRDTADVTREHNPLVMATDAVEIETSSLAIDEVVDQVIRLLPEA